MRGKVILQLFRQPMVRITPAYAGKSGTVLTSEKFGKGSPPPMRGKALVMSMHTEKDRITPAYAGKSSRPVPDSVIVKDHPRLCGEKCCCVSN